MMFRKRTNVFASTLIVVGWLLLLVAVYLVPVNRAMADEWKACPSTCNTSCIDRENNCGLGACDNTGSCEGCGNCRDNGTGKGCACFKLVSLPGGGD